MTRNARISSRSRVCGKRCSGANASTKSTRQQVSMGRSEAAAAAAALVAAVFQLVVADRGVAAEPTGGCWGGQTMTKARRSFFRRSASGAVRP